MKSSAQKITASTQKFTQIRDIRENVVLLTGGNACLVIQVTSVNFALLSAAEQDAKVYAYAAFLNSLSFPVQIIARSKKLEITPYLTSLDKAAATTSNSKLAQDIKQYKSFVEALVKTTSVLDKEFYLVMSYSTLEGGIKTSSAIGIKEPNIDEFFIQAKAALGVKADGVLSQFDRLGLKATILKDETLIKLFHDIYNEGGVTTHV